MPSLIAFHGMFGAPSDFKILGLSGLEAVSIFKSPASDLKAWAARFNQRVPKGRILLGYSMGGRLALHCLLENPELYRAAIIIAAHPGLLDLRLRFARHNEDRRWAKKILDQPWDELMDEWDSLPLFARVRGPERLSSDFHRPDLALFMRKFSLGRQDYLTPRINELNLPLLWLYPEGEGQNIKGLSLKHPHSQLVARPGGHRFLWNSDNALGAFIYPFLNRLSC